MNLSYHAAVSCLSCRKIRLCSSVVALTHLCGHTAGAVFGGMGAVVFGGYALAKAAQVCSTAWVNLLSAVHILMTAAISCLKRALYSLLFTTSVVICSIFNVVQSGSLAASFQGTGYNPPRRRPIYRIDNAALKAERAARRPQIPDTAKVDESIPPANQ